MLAKSIMSRHVILSHFALHECYKNIFVVFLETFEHKHNNTAIKIIHRNINKLILKLRTSGKHKFIGQKVCEHYL